MTAAPKLLGWLTVNDVKVLERELDPERQSRPWDRLMIPHRLAQKDQPHWDLIKDQNPIVYLPFAHGTPDHLTSSYWVHRTEAQFVQANGNAYTDRIAWSGRTEKWWYDDDALDPIPTAALYVHLLQGPMEISDCIMFDYIDWQDEDFRIWQLDVIWRVKTMLGLLGHTPKIITNGRVDWGNKQWGHWVESMGKIDGPAPGLSVEQVCKEITVCGGPMVFDTFRLNPLTGDQMDEDREQAANWLALATDGYVCPGRIRAEGSVTR